jgi:hypothetical protein
MAMSTMTNFATILTVEVLVVGLDKPFLPQEVLVLIHHAVSASINPTIKPFLTMSLK